MERNTSVQTTSVLRSTCETNFTCGSLSSIGADWGAGTLCVCDTPPPLRTPRICNGLIPNAQPAIRATTTVPRPTPWIGRKPPPLEPRTSSTLRLSSWSFMSTVVLPDVFRVRPADCHRSLLVKVLQKGRFFVRIGSVSGGLRSFEAQLVGIGLRLANLHAADDLRVIGERLLNRPFAFHDVVRDVESEGIRFLAVAMDGELAAGAVDEEAAVVFHEVGDFSDRHAVVDRLLQDILVRVGEVVLDLLPVEHGALPGAVVVPGELVSVVVLRQAILGDEI